MSAPPKVSHKRQSMRNRLRWHNLPSWIRELGEPAIATGRSRKYAAGTALVLAAALNSCSGARPLKSQPAARVQAATVCRMEIRQEISAEAIVFPIHEATIVPKISAPIAKFYVNRGDDVRSGQLLAVLANRDLVAAVAESKGAYEEAQANYQNATKAVLPVQMHAAEQNLQNARAAFHSAQYLYQSDQALYEQGALAKEILDRAQVASVQAKNNMAIAQKRLQALRAIGETSEVKAAEGQLEAAKGKYEAATAELAYSEIRSPITGVVTNRPLYQGAMATAGTPLMTIMDTARIVARSHIPQQQAELLKTGDSAKISTPGETTAVAGKVILVSPALDPDSTTVEIWVESPNPHGQFIPGAAVNVTITSKTVPNALTVPAAALVMKPNQAPYVVLIGADGRAHRRNVQVGIKQANTVQITAGLREGERVVTADAYGLPDDVRVQVEKTNS